MSDQDFTCPHCKQEMEVPEELLGQVLDCPACGKQIQPLSEKRSESPQVALRNDSKEIKKGSITLSPVMIIGLIIFSLICIAIRMQNEENAKTRKNQELMKSFDVARKIYNDCFATVPDTVQVSDSDIKVIVTRQPADELGLTEDILTDVNVIKILGDSLESLFMKRSEQAFRSKGGTGTFNPNIVTKAWGASAEGKNFVIVKIESLKIIQMTTIIGIKDGDILKISGSKQGTSPVPHSYGPVAEKMKEIFGVSFQP